MSTNQIEGLAELSRKLSKLEAGLAAKTLRQAAMNAATPVVREARLRIPVGEEAHRTYKGNLVSPGFAKRNIKKKIAIKDGRAVVSIGVAREAFYVVQFLELGTRYIPETPWLVPSFVAQRRNVEQRMAAQLKTKIEKLSR